MPDGAATTGVEPPAPPDGAGDDPDAARRRRPTVRGPVGAGADVPDLEEVAAR